MPIPFRFRDGSLVLAAVMLLYIPPASSGAENQPNQNAHLWQPKTRSVAVFKNGLGFFTQQASVALHDGWCYARDVPPAAFGTLAVYATNADQVVDIVGAGAGEMIEFERHDAAVDLEAKRAKLEASRGLKIRLDYTKQNSDRQATGVLVSVGDDYAVIEDDEQTFAVPLAAVKSVQLIDLPLRVHVAEGEDASAQRAELGMAYLRTGILWIPEYTLKLLDEENAELTLRGTLINEAEDLVHCDVSFVVGVPHFVHSDLMSPMAVGRAIRSIGSVMPQHGVPPQMMSQMMNRAAIANNAMTSDAFAPGGEGSTAPAGNELHQLLGNLPPMESAGAGDFTVYTKENLTVRRGERAMVTLLTQRIRYSHRYHWEIGGQIEHFLTLQNSSSTPWTTGPCLAVSGGQPLSEDVLKYTPVGSRGEIRVTTAINVAHDEVEAEAKRDLKAHEPRDNEFFDLVTVRGSIRLKSFEKKPVEVSVSAAIQGRPVEASDEGKMRIDASKLRLIERSGTISWQAKLQPGEERVLQYVYERYVPSN